MDFLAFPFGLALLALPFVAWARAAAAERVVEAQQRRIQALERVLEGSAARARERAGA